MNVNWDWSNRSIRAIQSLAKQWNVDIWATGLATELNEENSHTFKRYESECVPVGNFDKAELDYSEVPFPDESYDNFFDPWASDQGVLDASFYYFNNN